MLDSVLDLLQALAAAPGVDHGPTGQEHVRVVTRKGGERVVGVDAAGGAVFRVPGDGDGQRVVAAEVVGDLAIRSGAELALEHALGSGNERQAGVDVGLVHRMDMDVDGAQGAFSGLWVRWSAWATLSGRGRMSNPLLMATTSR